MNRSPWRLEEGDGSPWRLEEVDGGDEQYPLESCFAVATPLLMNRTPVSTVALQHKSISSVLRYVTPLPINRTPFQMWPVEHKAVSSVVQYARPRFHRLFRPSPPDEHDHEFHSDPAGWLPRVPLPPDEHDAFRCLPMNTMHSVASP